MKLFYKGKNTFVATILNIVGLTFALTALYIIIVQVRYDLTYNHNIKDSERLYVIATEDWYEEGKFATYVSRPLGEYIIENTPVIESGGVYAPFGVVTYLNKNDEDPVAVSVSDASLNGIETLGFEAIEGRWSDLVGTTVALSESMAQRLGAHVGDTFKSVSTNFFWNQSPVETTIAVIYEDMAQNSDLALSSAIANIENWGINDPDEWSFNYFIKLHENVSMEEAQEAIDQALRAIRKENGLSDDDEEDDESVRIKLFPLNEVYYNTLLSSPGKQGNKTTTYTLLGVAILIIIIALINYVNFFFAQIPVKLKSVNTRRILGSSRSKLITSMMSESILMMLVALGLGAILVVLFDHSEYNGLISTTVLMNHHWGMTFITIGVGMVIAVVASFYPAWYITSFKPALALRGSLGSTKKGNAFRTGLIGFQFTISIILIVCAIFIDQQRHYMLHHDLGFDKENLLTAEVSKKIAFNRESMENRLATMPSIKEITWADGPIVAEGRMGWGRSFNGQTVHMESYPVAWNFLQFMGIPIIQGRDFVRSDEEIVDGLFIFNREGSEKYDIKVGDRISGHRDSPAEVIGISENFNYSPLRKQGGAFCFYMMGKYPWRPLRQLFVRTNSGVNPLEVKETLVKVLCEMDPERNPSLWDVQLLDSSIENLYVRERNLSELINLFTLLAIVISLMGVFGLVMFETEYRRKEIGVRRVNGSTIEQILLMFNTRFVKIILVCFLIAGPLSWWIVSVYLESYAYRTPIRIWVFLISLLAVLIITIGVVTLRSFRAATVNPVKSLRSE